MRLANELAVIDVDAAAPDRAAPWPASHDAAFLTGVALPVDGGCTAR